MSLHRGMASIYLALGAAFAPIVTGCSDIDGVPADPVETDPATRYVARGPHAVGHRVADADDMLVKAWYPAALGDDTDAFEHGITDAIEYAFVLKFPGFPADPVSALGHAIEDAAPAEGRFPLVVLSHGFGLNPEWYHGLAEHMASHGFVVMAPEHVEHDWAPDVVHASVARPADVSATIDFALSGPLEATVDADHVAVVGHSYGGFTALAVAGARFDTTGLAEHCADVEDPFIAGYFCEPFIAGEDALAAEMGLDAAPDDLWPSLRDPRVDAIVSLAGDAHLFGERGLASVTVPALLMGGTADTGSPWDWGVGLAFDHIRSDYKALVGFEGSEHFIGVSSCDDLPFMQVFPEDMRAYICQDPTWEKSAELDMVNQLTTAFLVKTIGRSSEGDASLDPALYDAVDGLQMTVRRRPDLPAGADRGPVGR